MGIKRRLAMLLATVIIFTSLPLDGSRVYASEFSGNENIIENVLVSKEVNEEGVLVETENSGETGNISNEKGVLVDGGILEDSSVIIEQDDKLINEESIVLDAVSDEGASEAIAADGDEAIIINKGNTVSSGSLKGASWTITDTEGGKRLEITGKVTSDENVPLNVSLTEQGSPIARIFIDSGNEISPEDVVSAKISVTGIKDLGLLFAGFTNLKEVDFSGIDTENAVNACGMFYGCSSLESLDLTPISFINCNAWCVKEVNSFDYFFEGCDNLSCVKLVAQNIPSGSESITFPYSKDYVWKNEYTGKYAGVVSEFTDYDVVYPDTETEVSYIRLPITEAEVINVDDDELYSVAHEGAFINSQLISNTYKSGNGIKWTISKSGNKVAKIGQKVFYHKGNVIHEGTMIEALDGVYEGIVDVVGTYGNNKKNLKVYFQNPLRINNLKNEYNIENISDNNIYVPYNLLERYASFEFGVGNVPKPIYGDEIESKINAAKEYSFPYIIWELEDDTDSLKVDNVYLNVSETDDYEEAYKNYVDGLVKIAITDTVDKTIETTLTGTLYVPYNNYYSYDSSTKYYSYPISTEVIINVPETTKAPTASVAPGTVKPGTRVILNCETPNAEIYYSKNGTPSLDEYGKPCCDTYLYNDFLVINENVTISAIAVADGLKESDCVDFDYTVEDDWGDINEDIRGQIFESDIENVPEELWFVAKEYDESGNVTKYSRINAGEDTGITKTYTGNAITVDEDIEVYYDNKKLTKDKDYTLKYSNNINVATGSNKEPMVTLKGKGNFAGEALFYFTIDPADMDDADLISESVITMTEGKALNTCKPVIEFNGKKLTNKDYELAFFYATEDSKKEVSPKAKVISGYEYLVTVRPKNNNFTNVKENAFKIRGIAKKSKVEAAFNGVRISVPKQAWSTEGISAKALFDNSKGDSPAKVKKGNNYLIYGTDFVLKDEDAVYTDAGIYDVILAGLGDEGSGEVKYYGEKAAKLEITGIKSGNIKVGGIAGTVEYKGSAFELSDLNAKTKDGFEKVTLYLSKDKTKVLTQGKDYTVSFDNTGAVGKTEVVFSLMGQYTGIIKKQIKVKKCGMSNADLSVSVNNVTFSKKVIIPKVEVIYGDTTLKEGIDYKLSYSDNKKPGTGTVTVKGMGSFTGSRKVKFNIGKSNTEGFNLEVTDKVYTGKAGNYKQIPVLKEGGCKLAAADGLVLPGKKDWKYYDAENGRELGAKENAPIGTIVKVIAEVIVKPGSPYYDGEDNKEKTVVVSGYYRIIDKQYDISKAKVVIDPESSWCMYNNDKELIPSKIDITITTKSGDILNTEDYDIVSVEDSRLPGDNAVIVIRGKGNYGGTLKVTVKIKTRTIDN